MAAAGGHLEVLQWLRANGCPWDVNTCRRAFAGGHYDMLEWAKANGCPSHFHLGYYDDEDFDEDD